MSREPIRIKIDDEVWLKELEEKDAIPIFALVQANRLHLRAWLPWVDATQTVDDEAAFIRSVRMQQEGNGSFICGIWYRGLVVGTIGYHIIDWLTRKVEIGYWLGAQFQGKGFMTRSCAELLRYAFEELHLNKVEIRCATGNHRSRAVPERLGFTREGLIRQAEWLYDHYEDLFLYGILATEWRAMQPR
jgi:ribosomal-protein-serine acetyltransferase